MSLNNFYNKLNDKLTFFNVTDREEYLHTNNINFLFSKLPEKIKAKLVKGFLHEIPERDQADILEYFTNYSQISKYIIEQPGSSRAFEHLYTKTSSTHIDEYFINSAAGTQIHQRLVSLVKKIPLYINNNPNKEKFLIDNIGSGPGRDIICTLAENAMLKKDVHIRNIDPDHEAHAIGKYLVDKLELSHCFEFYPEKYQSVSPRQADLILLIGVFCPLSLSLSKRILRELYNYLKEGGILIYSTALNKMCFDDPFTEYLMRLHGWRMNYKNVEASKDIALKNNFKINEIFFDEPHKHHCMVVCEK